MLVNHALLKNRVGSASGKINELRDPEIVRSWIKFRTWFRVTNKGFFSCLHNKKPSLWMKDWVFFYLTLHSLPSKTYCEAHSGRFSGLRIVLLPAPSHPFRPFDKLRVQDSGFGKFRTRLQRRGRPRLSRGSLWLQATWIRINFYFLIPQFLSRCQIFIYSFSRSLMLLF